MNRKILMISGKQRWNKPENSRWMHVLRRLISQWHWSIRMTLPSMGMVGRRLRAGSSYRNILRSLCPVWCNISATGGGRGFPTNWLLYPSAGYATFVMDTRGQGSTWQQGDTPDLIPDGSSPHFPGFMTLGVLDPQTYYYRRVFTDAVRALEAAKQHPLVDAQRLIVTGGSQGGGITLAVSGLVPDLAAVMPDVPFLCHFYRAVTMTDEDPYHEIARFLKVHRDKTEVVFRTLSYFDGMQFAVRATAPALFSTGLMDLTCPPSTVFAAFNHYNTRSKDIKVYPFNLHDGGGSHHDLEKLKFLKKILG